MLRGFVGGLLSVIFLLSMAPTIEATIYPYPYCGNGICEYGETALNCPYDCGLIYPPVYFPYCGNGICEYGENLLSCPYDCGLLVPPFPFLSSCSLTAYPSSISAGSTSTIAVNYFNTPYEPISTLVNCGNGNLAIAYGCYGFSGVCFAVCSYPNAGTFTPSALAGGVACSSHSITVSGGGGGTPPPTPTVPPTSPSRSCSVFTNPSSLIEQGSSTITVTYSGFSATPQGRIVCGDGQSVAAACSGGGSGSCTGTCTYSNPDQFPAHFIVDSTLDGVSCASGGVTIRKSTNPGNLLVRVVNQTFAPLPNAVVEVEGNIQFTNASGETAFRLNEGRYDVRASKTKHTTAVGTTRVEPDKTTLLTLQISELFDSSCQVSVSPNVVRGGLSTLVTVSYKDATVFPSSILVSCGNGQTAQATCSGTPSQGTCTTTCPYAVELDTTTYTVSATVNEKACSTQSVRVVKPLPSTGNFVAKVTSCESGATLQGAEVRVSTPRPTIPTNFSGDGTYSMQPSQTARTNNGMIVRLDRIAQVRSSSTDRLSFFTGERDFSTSTTDTQTTSQSHVRIVSSLVNSFKFGSGSTNVIYYVTDSVPAGRSAQGVIFYQDPTTANFVPFLHPNAEGNVTYPAGTRLSGTSLTSASIVNATALTGCSTFNTTTAISSFTNFTTVDPLTVSGGTPTVDGYTLKNFNGRVNVTAQSVNASCTSGNYTLSFQNTNGALTPGLGNATYSITFNYAEYNYGVPVMFQFYAPGITIGPNDPHPGNGHVIAVPEYLDASNTSQGAFLLDIGFGDRSTPVFLPASGPPAIVYNESFTSKTLSGIAQPNGFLSPRGSNATISLNLFQLDYGLVLAGPRATISILNADGNLVKQEQVERNGVVSTVDVSARVNTIAGNTAQIEVQSLTASTPPATTFFTNEFGEAAAQLDPGTYSVEYFKNDFGLERGTVTVTQASTTSQSVCLKPKTCDFNVELISAPTCAVSSDAYQFRIQNKVNQSKSISLTYSASEIQGPSTVVLGPQENTIVNLRARSAQPAISGQSLGLVNFRGSDACTQSFTLPLCIAQEITLSVPQTRISTQPGQTVCTAALVKNKALENVLVALTASTSLTSLRTALLPETVLLTPLEVRNVDVCVTPPAGFSGSASLSLKASSPFGEANATLDVDARGQTFYTSDFSGCPAVDAFRIGAYTVTLKNNAEDGDFVLDIEDNPLTVQKRFALPQFQKDTSRTVTLQFEPQDVNAGELRFNAFLKKDGFVVFQQNLCFTVQGITTVSADLNENNVDLVKGQSRSVFLTVRNIGSVRASYSIQSVSPTLQVNLNPSAFTLKPNQEQVVEVILHAPESASLRTYTISLKVLAGSVTADTENLLVNVVEPGSQPLVLSTAELTLSTIPPQQVFPGTTIQIPVSVKNENYFTIDNILVYVQNLPAGVMAVPPTKFTLARGEQKTVFVRVEATPPAQIGTRTIEIVVESALTQPAKQRVFLSVLLSSTSQLNAAVKLTVSLKGNNTFDFEAAIRNDEAVALSVTPMLELPQGWSYNVEPRSFSLAPGGEAAFKGAITPFGLDPNKEYDATLVLQSSDGRIQRLPFKIRAQGGDVLAGFVTLGEGVQGAGIAVFLLLLAVAAFLIAGAHQHRRRT